MQHRRLLAASLVAASMLLLLGGSSPIARAAGGGDPFAYSASVGPEAASHVDASVTRVVDGRQVTLPAAAVPALQPGDEVRIRFPDYTSPPSVTKYHTDVAFITERPPVQWLFGKSGPWDGLFRPPHRRGAPAAGIPEIDFTYGVGNRQGIPIFFIVPEDKQTRGMNGVRDYVDAHPTDFKDMSVSADQAVERYSWFRDFLNSLAQGAFDPTAQQRVVAIATSLGASASGVEACYTEGATSSEIADCVQTQLVSVQYQTNIEAPTQAQFFGGLASAAAPTQLALYLQPLLAIWQIFSRAGHAEYEYLPTTLHLLDPAKVASTSAQLLMGMKVPTLRPPGATSSALFFTIGDPAAVSNPPTLVDDDAGTGVCVSADRVRSPLHLDQTSPYVNDAALVVTDALGGDAKRIAIDPAKAAAPLIDRTGLADGDGYTVRFTGRFGFDPIADEARLNAHLAVPGASHWQLTQVADRAAVAGGTLDVIAASPDAPCLSGAELQLGGNPPVPLKIARLDAQHVELTGSLASVPAGVAEIRLSENDRVHGRLIAGTAIVAIAGEPAGVDPKSNPTAFLGDRALLLSGHGFDRVSGVRIASSLYTKTPESRGDVACFVGPPIGGGAATAGTSITAELVPAGGRAGEAFPLLIDAPRPALASVAASPTDALHLSTDRLAVTLSSSASLPRTFAVRLRRAPATDSPCGGLRKDPSASVVPAADAYRASVAQLALALRAGDVLPGNAFGTLQVQLVDASTGVASDWIDLPGHFVRAPVVTNVACPNDASEPCTLWGTGLAAIAGVVGPDGKPVAPGLDCLPTDKVECRSVPHLAQYRLTLRDAPLTIAVPDRLVAGNAPAVAGAKPSPAPSGG